MAFNVSHLRVLGRYLPDSEESPPFLLCSYSNLILKNRPTQRAGAGTAAVAA